MNQATKTDKKVKFFLMVCVYCLQWLCLLSAFGCVLEVYNFDSGRTVRRKSYH